MSDFVQEQDPNICLGCGKRSETPLRLVRWVRHIDAGKQVYALSRFPMPMCNACVEQEVETKMSLENQGYEDRSESFARKLAREERA